jgi:uncharacterized membrane protein (DUF485 family)
MRERDPQGEPAADRPGADWDALERSPEFEQLVASRRRFVVPALTVFVVWFGGFLILTGYARDFMGEKVIGNFTWAYVLALSLIVMTWAIAWLYLRFSEGTLVPLVEETRRRAEEGDR